MDNKPTVSREDAADTWQVYFQTKLADLLSQAQQYGLVITVDLESDKHAPAMGKYRMVGHVRNERALQGY